MAAAITSSGGSVCGQETRGHAHKLLLCSAPRDVTLELALQVRGPAPNGPHLLPSSPLSLSLSLSECVSRSAAVYSIEKLPANVMNEVEVIDFCSFYSSKFSRL